MYINLTSSIHDVILKHLDLSSMAPGMWQSIL